MAIFADHGIDYSGWDLLVDGFDSGDPARSTDGLYDPTKAGDAGDVVATHGITHGLPVVGSALIYGHLAVGSNVPVILGNNGGVGTHAWLAANSGIEPGCLVDSVAVAFPDTTPPYSSGLTPGSGDVFIPPDTIQSYDHILHNGDYFATDLDGRTIVLGEARLVVANGLTRSGLIRIASGGSLILYCDGTSGDPGRITLWNESGLARNFILYSSPAVTNLTVYANSGFTGVVIAPYADVKLTTGGTNVVDISGSLMVRSLQLYGNFHIHFDQSLTAAATLRAGSLSAAGSGQFQFEVVGFPGFTYVVQSSTDLASWSSITTNRSPFTFTEATKSPFGRRFYRCLLSP